MIGFEESYRREASDRGGGKLQGWRQMVGVKASGTGGAK